MICPFNSTALNNTVNILQDSRYKVRPENEAIPKLFQELFIGEIFGVLARMNDGSYHRQLKDIILKTLSNFNEIQYQKQIMKIIKSSKIVIDSPETLTIAIQNWSIMIIAEQIGLPQNDQLISHVKQFVDCMNNQNQAEYISLGNESAIWLYEMIECSNGPLKQAFIKNGLHKEIASPIIINGNLMGFFFQSLDSISGLIGLRLLKSNLSSIKNTRRFLDNQMIVLPLIDKEETLPFGTGEHRCPGEQWAKIIVTTIETYLTQLPIQPQWLNHYQWKESLNACVPLFISSGELS